jgi:plastocyanin
VQWVNNGKHNHTVTVQDESWDSGDIQPGKTYGATFKNPGTYYYFCRHHRQDKMQGVIVVGSGAARNAPGQAAAPGGASTPQSY